MTSVHRFFLALHSVHRHAAWAPSWHSARSALAPQHLSFEGHEIRRKWAISVAGMPLNSRSGGRISGVPRAPHCCASSAKFSDKPFKKNLTETIFFRFGRPINRRLAEFLLGYIGQKVATVAALQSLGQMHALVRKPTLIFTVMWRPARRSSAGVFPGSCVHYQVYQPRCGDLK